MMSNGTAQHEAQNYVLFKEEINNARGYDQTSEMIIWRLPETARHYRCEFAEPKP